LPTPAELLLFDRSLGRGESFEALVGNGLAALDGEPEGTAGESRFGPLERRKLFGEILGKTCVELILIEVLGAVLAGFVLVGERVRIVGTKSSDRLLDPVALTGKQVACAIIIHARRLSLGLDRMMGLGLPG